MTAPAPPRALRVGLISDTHGLLRPQALAVLAGSDCILHAGDIGDPEILDRLAGIAPVTAVRGNNDAGGWALSLPETVTVRLGCATARVLHDLADLRDTTGIDVVVCGHSHRPQVERRNGLLLVNPGSAGPRRFKLPVSVARLHVAADGRCEAELVPIDVA